MDHHSPESFVPLMYMKSKRQVCPKPFPRGRQKGRVHPHGHALFFYRRPNPPPRPPPKPPPRPPENPPPREPPKPPPRKEPEEKPPPREPPEKPPPLGPLENRSLWSRRPDPKSAEASTAGPSRSPWRRRRGRLTPPPAVPAVRGAVPEQNRPEHIGRIDHSVISLTISGIARAVNQGGRHQRRWPEE